VIPSLSMKMQIPENLLTRITLMALPDGVAGIKATVALMVKLAQQSKRDYTIRNRALFIVEGLRQKAWFDEIRALHEYVRDEVRYVRDINGVETLATPVKTLQSMQGDCDDKALLLAALLESLGHETRFVAVGFTPGQYDHVLVETKVRIRAKDGTRDKWIPLETTEQVAPGWYPPGVVQRMVQNV
jgi:transglutaminase-like putative cysteine protease